MHKAFAYILGFAFGDGNISKKGSLIRLYDENAKFVRKVLRERFIESFNEVPGISFDKSNNSYVLHKRSAIIWKELKNYGIPPGRKARIISVPEPIIMGSRATQTQFVSGVFDAEASINTYKDKNRHPLGYTTFQVKMFSPRFIDGLGLLLCKISCRFNPRLYHYSYGSFLRLNGKEQLRLVASRLPLEHPRFSPLAR